MEAVEVFNMLESDNLQVVEDIKKKFAEFFNMTKDAWLVNFLIDYYLETNSVRVVDVLLKVQSPHDKFIFDRILDLIRNTNKQKGLNILGIIVRRQPTWLYHIMQHTLFKETLKLLKVETDIVPFMSALLCIIALLPMVPSLICPFLMDIFEIFSRLAAWKSNNKLPEDQLIHLQVGLCALFHRLYGMFPCNFVSYLKNKYSSRDQSVIFGHTIKPLLETVKMHPLLITTSKEGETNNTRWKNMEAHDVVVECTHVVVENIVSSDPPAECLTNAARNTDYSAIDLENSALSRCHLGGPDSHMSKSIDHTSDEKEFWSPSFVCPPSTPPQTPTPTPNAHNFTPNITPSLMATNISATKNDGQEGASPPEAAVEATPESTPLRDMRVRPIPNNSTVARALNAKLLTTVPHNTSQPSSPLKKDSSLFRYPDTGHTEPTSLQKLSRVISDRSQSLSDNNVGPFRYTNPTSPMRVTSHDGVYNNNVTGGDTAQNADSSNFSVDDLETSSFAEKDVDNTVENETMEQDNSGQEDQFEDCIPASCTTCASGGLHVPNSRSMKDFAERVKRLRFYSQCNNDAMGGGYYKGFSAGSSPADSTVIFPKIKRLRRTESCPDLNRRPTPLLEKVSKVTKLDEIDDKTVKEEAKTEPADRSATRAVVCRADNSTQTVSFWPQPFELLYVGLFPFGDNSSNSRRASQKDQAPLQQQQQQATPCDLLDRYIQCCVDRRREDKGGGQESSSGGPSEARSLREQLQLLHIELQFERHRRELHADRNRRLLGKSRDSRALEETNAALREQLQLLQNDTIKLNQQLESKRALYATQECDWKAINDSWKERYNALTEEQAGLRATCDSLRQQLAQQAERHATASRELQEARAALFELEQEMRLARQKAEIGEKYQTQLQHMHNELLLMGELQSRYRDKLAELPWLRDRDEELKILQATYQNEISTMQQTLESKSSALEGAKSKISELEMTLSRREAMFAEQKRLLKNVKENFQVQLDSVEDKYAAQKSINQRMEEQLLELYRSESVAPVSPDGSMKGADKSGGAIVGSWDLWAGSSPLSASLASSEGMMSSGTASGFGGRTDEIKNLQVIVDQPEQPSGSAQPEQNEPSTESREID